MLTNPGNNFLFGRSLEAATTKAGEGAFCPDQAWAERFQQFFGDVYSPNRVGLVDGVAGAAERTVVPTDESFARFFRTCT